MPPPETRDTRHTHTHTLFSALSGTLSPHPPSPKNPHPTSRITHIHETPHSPHPHRHAAPCAKNKTRSRKQQEARSKKQEARPPGSLGLPGMAVFGVPPPAICKPPCMGMGCLHGPDICICYLLSAIYLEVRSSARSGSAMACRLD